MGLQVAVRRMFADMNGAFMEATGWEFQNHIERMAGTFLTRFDAIFTVNQDMLLEHYYYVNDSIALTGKKKWAGAQLPGIRRVPAQERLYANSWARSTWMPEPEPPSRSRLRSSRSSSYMALQTGRTPMAAPRSSWVGPRFARLVRRQS